MAKKGKLVVISGPSGVGKGTEKTITLSNVRSADSRTLTVTLTNVMGISAPIKYETGKGIVRTFTGQVAPENISEANFKNLE